jgi:selenoprotein W-related protein
VSAISDLLSHYQHIIADVRIVMGTRGVFDVVVDGTMLYSKHETGRHAEPGEVLELFTQHVGSDVPRYKDT